MDRLEERETAFFADCLKNISNKEDREAEFAKIKQEYSKAIEVASEKVACAEDCYGLVDRYLRKLDDELGKFKMELEADNRGITEILEKQSLEMDVIPSASVPLHLKENRLPKRMAKKSLHTKDKRSNFPINDILLPLDVSSPSTPGTSYPLQHMGPGGNAIAQAASQAIAATQQLTGRFAPPRQCLIQNQKIFFFNFLRRTSSLKASFEAINHGLPTHEFSIGRELAGAAAVAAAAHAASGFASEGLDDGPPSKKRKSNKSSEPVLDVVSGGLLGDDSLMEPGMSSDLLSGDLRDQDWNLDPNEPRYCICHQVSYGDMVACDNEDVSVPLQFDKFSS